MKKKIDGLRHKVFFLLLLAVAGMAKAQQWNELQTGVTEDLYDVYCLDTNTVFVCGSNGVILKTKDGGNSWQEKYRQEGYDWYAIKFLDPNTGFVLGINDGVGNNEKLLKTINGGETWLDMGNPFNEYNYCSPSTCDLFVVDSDTLYVACDQLMKSTDGGCSFSQMDIEWIEATQDLYFEGNVGYIVWGEPGIFIGTHVAKTIDYGSSWEEILSFDYTEYGIEKAVFHDKDHVSLYGGFGGVDQNLNFVYTEIKTEDGFATCQWLLNETIPTGGTVYPPIAGICYSDSQNGIAVYVWHDFNPNSSITTFQTQNGGDIWNELGTIECPYSQFAAICGCEGVYYLAMEEGNVYKMKTSFDGILEKKENALAFPNPTNSMVTITGENLRHAELLNVLGQQVLSVQSKGNELHIDMTALPSGVYFVTVTDEEGRKCVRKVVKE
ncbi:MAG: T9SS type A sorting domain-containing protein [Bacteroidales bacterium]|nr:T9SS type A sorting domain-containing protein [Bacteroidales bacterium]